MVEGFQHTELGVIPNDWGVKTLGEVGEVKMCRRVFNHETKPQGPIPFYKIGTFGKEADAYISQELYNSYRQKFSFPKRGDVLISAAGTIGRTLVYDGKPSYFQDSNIVWIDNNGKLIPNEFLYHVFQVVKYNTEGGTIQRLYNSILRNTKFICPPTKAEQTAIATALNDADALITQKEKLIAKKRAIKQGAMQELLKPKEGWVVDLIGNHIAFQVGYPFSSIYFNQKQNGIRLVKNRDLKSDDLVYHYNGEFNKEFLVKNGDVLISMDGEFISCLWNKGEALLNQRVGKIVARKKVSVPFMFYYLQKPLKEIEDRTSSTTVKHLSHSDIENIVIPIPKHEEQIRIAQILSDMDNEIQGLERKLVKFQMLKQGMMQNLLTGKIRLI